MKTKRIAKPHAIVGALLLVTVGLAGCSSGPSSDGPGPGQSEQAFVAPGDEVVDTGASCFLNFLPTDVRRTVACVRYADTPSVENAISCGRSVAEALGASFPLWRSYRILVQCGVALPAQLLARAVDAITSLENPSTGERVTDDSCMMTASSRNHIQSENNYCALHNGNCSSLCSQNYDQGLSSTRHECHPFCVTYCTSHWSDTRCAAPPPPPPPPPGVDAQIAACAQEPGYNGCSYCCDSAPRATSLSWLARCRDACP